MAIKQGTNWPDALHQANATRLKRAELKKKVAVGELRISALLENPYVATMLLWDLLQWQRRWGAAKARAALTKLGIGQYRKVGTLTERERGIISEMTDRDRRPVRGESWRPSSQL